MLMTSTLFDLAKAFDEVPHKRLLIKLKDHGIDGKVLQWIENWLKGRKQRVHVKGFASNWLPVTSGVPQGSGLGPVLFLIYVNDMDSDLHSWILKFADDTKIFNGIKDKSDCAMVQQDLNTLQNWATKWEMSFNASKCKVMHIGKQLGTGPYEYVINGQKLEVVTKEKDLGIILSNNLKVADQCAAACAKANKMLGLINRNIENKNKFIMLQLYKSLVRPHIDYCTVAWSPYYVEDKVLPEKVQRVTQMVPCRRNSTTY